MQNNGLTFVEVMYNFCDCGIVRNFESANTKVLRYLHLLFDNRI